MKLERIGRMARLRLLVLASGVAYTLYLQALVPAGVFLFDAGGKFLMARQFSRGDLHFDLRLRAEPWTVALWERGLYPIGYPNVITVAERHYVLYPVGLPLLSALPLRLMGFRGLYLLPLTCTWLAWWGLLCTCRALRVGAYAATAGLFAVVFGSPLTFYSATFWEHTPAVALALVGMALGFRQPDRGKEWAPVLGGLLLGISPLLREEQFVLVGLLGAGTALAWLLGRPASTAGRARPFLVGLALALGLLFVINWACYGHPLGLHAIAALNAREWARVTKAVDALRLLAPSVVEYFPPALLAGAGIPYLWWRGRARPLARVSALLALSLLITVCVPLLVRVSGGRRWGPRYLLMAVPLLALAAAIVFQELRREGRRTLRLAGMTIALLLTTHGCWLNTVGGTRYLRDEYRSTTALHALVRDSPARVVAVSSGWLTLQLAGLFDDKVFFEAQGAGELRTLARGLAQAGQSRFVYVCHTDLGCGPFQAAPPSLTFYKLGTTSPLAIFERLAAFDSFLVYGGTVVEGVGGG